MKFGPLINLFLGILFLSACTKQDQPKNNPTEIKIAGIVTAISNGKDGYTATIQTAKKETYTALVSIPNLGKDGGYQRVDINDQVSFAGELLQGNSNHLIVRQIIDVKSNQEDLTIYENAFLGISPGDDIADHLAYLQADQLKTSEGAFEIYHILGKDKTKLGYLHPAPNDDTKVGRIIINTPAPKTTQEISVGDTFAKLQIKQPALMVHGSEIEGRTYAKIGQLSYRLDAANFSYQLDVTKIPTDSKILEIIINP